MQLGTFPCDCSCCNGTERTFDDQGVDIRKMRCTHCGCPADRPMYGLTIRLYVHGPLTLERLGHAQEVALLLGASSELELERERADRHFVEIPSEVIAARLEIERIKGANGAPEKAARSARTR